jgi:soluble lytic murein transglycosylase
MQGRRYKPQPERTWARIGIFVVLATVIPGTLTALGDGALAQSVRTSALTPESETAREAALPTLLSPGDAERYRRIFSVQAEGDWLAADREIAGLNDRSLLGAVEAQRYLHRRYHTSYAEAAQWLAHHADEPDAKAIYALAGRLRPSGARAPAAPSQHAFIPRRRADDAAPHRHRVDAAEIAHRDAMSDYFRMTPAERRRAKQLRLEIRDLATADPGRAEAMLGGPEAILFLDRSDIVQLRAGIAEGYRNHAAAPEAQRVDVGAGDSHWQAGLAAWRQGRFSEAGAHFQAVARASGQSSWKIAAGAFWAARVEFRNRRPELVSYWLGIAAGYPRTFYGLLARRMLGVDTVFRFDTDAFTDADAQMLSGAPGGRRALGLLQVGQTARAEAELRGLAPQASPEMIESLVALADRANMPGLSLQLAGHLADGEGRHQDRALYPVPRWTPIGGFNVDRALLFALMRQESEFLPRAQSNAGAVGLMQLMPATARAMLARHGVTMRPRDQRALDAIADPEINMALAQDYIRLLLRDPHINGNLMLMATAYNGGLGAAQRAQSSPALRKDPLLYLESIPTGQTRVFTQRVLTNYWIYRLRLGQPSPDLDALAAGRWPTYTALDATENPGSRHAENR